MRIVLHPEARAELSDAAMWYDEQLAGLGDEFVAEVASVVDRIEAAPSSFPLWPGVSLPLEPIRRGILHRFPYMLAFRMERNEVNVLVVAHARRQPLYWLKRASPSPG